MNYYYGGAFDPLTKAHLAIIKAISENFINEDNVLFIGVTDDDEKQYTYGVKKRKEIVEDALREYGIEATVIRQNKRTYNFLKETFSNNVILIVGSDEYEQLSEGKWENNDKLTDEYKFIVVKRDDKPLEKKDFLRSSVKIDSRFSEFSSTKARDAIRLLRNMVDKKTLKTLFE